MFSNHIHLARWVLWQMDLLQLQAADWTLWFGHHGCGEFLVWVVSCQGSSCWPLQQQRHEVWTSPASSVLVKLIHDKTDISIHHITWQDRHLSAWVISCQSSSCWPLQWQSCEVWTSPASSVLVSTSYFYYRTEQTFLYIILQDRTDISIQHITWQNWHLYTSYYRTELTSLYIILQDRTDISHKMCLWVWAK